MTSAFRLRDARGTAVPETALVVAIFLMIMYATVQYGVLGYDQVSADGATFVGAHDTVAMYGGPSTASNSYTQKVISTVFGGLRAAQVSSIPNNGSYETDVTLSGVANQGLSSLLPTALQATSREIEASSSSAAASPLGNCALGVTSVVNGAGSTVTSGTVNLLQGLVGQSNGLFGLGTATSGISGQTVVDLNSGVISAHLAALQNVDTQLSATATQLQNLYNLLSVAGLGSGLGVTTPLVNQVSAILQPLLTQALTGKLTQATINQATQALSGTGGLLGAVASNLLAPILYGSGSGATAVPGLLSSPNGTGLLMTLSNAETAVNNLDQLAPAACPAP